MCPCWNPLVWEAPFVKDASLRATWWQASAQIEVGTWLFQCLRKTCSLRWGHFFCWTRKNSPLCFRTATSLIEPHPCLCQGTSVPTPPHCQAWPQDIFGPGESEQKWGHVTLQHLVANVSGSAGSFPSLTRKAFKQGHCQSVYEQQIHVTLCEPPRFGVVFVTAANLNTYFHHAGHTGLQTYWPIYCSCCLRNSLPWSADAFLFLLFWLEDNYSFLIERFTSYQDLFSPCL